MGSTASEWRQGMVLSTTNGGAHGTIEQPLNGAAWYCRPAGERRGTVRSAAACSCIPD